MIIKAPCGAMEGMEIQGIHQLLGIPYAKPPVGALRFMPTEPEEPWTGIRSCRKLGHAAPQLYVPGLTFLKKEETLDEDCLYLNVTTPDTTGKLPVLCWIHGGAFQKGSATAGINPPAFAREGMVVVNMNYRLGALGFMDMSGYLGDAYRQSGNSGLLDIIEALRWVRKNIASFGGDPDNVTIMGQSAGAKLCGALTIIKKARGLFQKAILCSGAVQCIRDVHTARCITEQFMSHAGLTKDRAHEILTMPWEAILKAQAPMFRGFNLHAAGPVFDGINFEGNDALALIRQQTGPRISLLMGTNRDETNLYWHIYHVHDMDEGLAEKLFGNRAPIVMKNYGKIPKDENFHQRFVHFLTEYIYRAGDIDMAETASDAGQDVYLYRLDWDRQAYKACHASETQFLMGLGSVIHDVDHSPAHEELKEEMHGAFTAFIKKGMPAAEGMPSWPKFDRENRRIMVFDHPCHVERAAASETDPAMPFQVFAL